jgi:hypothetical protein
MLYDVYLGWGGRKQKINRYTRPNKNEGRQKLDGCKVLTVTVLQSRYFTAQVSSPPTSPLVEEPAEQQRRRGRRCRYLALPPNPYDALRALRARSHFAIAPRSSWTQSYCTPREANRSAHAPGVAWFHLHLLPPRWWEKRRLHRHSMLVEVGHLHK